MRKFIIEQIHLVEQQQNCKILYACESGSRAWGFASPDSDYDLRFIYAHPLSWYLRLEQTPDTIEYMAPNELDLSGWELRKMLRLFRGCNLALFEWFDSPEIYYEEKAFTSGLRKLIPTYFNPKKAVHHYFSMAGNTIAQAFGGETVKIKKLFYVLRPLLACAWILDRQSMPPTSFTQLLDQPLAQSFRLEIDRLLVAKRTAVESEPICIPPILYKWITDTRDSVTQSWHQVPTNNCKDWEPLNLIAAEWINS